MSLTKITNSEMNTHGVRGLPDTPNLSAYDMQSKFDELATEVLRPAYDRLIDELEAESGAEQIGAVVPEGISSDANVQAILNNMATSNHSHGNKEVLDKFSVDEDDNLFYDGETIASKSFAKVIAGGVEITAGIDDVLTFLDGKNVNFEADESSKSITVNMSHEDENIFFRYSAYADGTDFVENPTIDTPYMGISIVFDEEAPTDKGAYHWVLIGIENQGVPHFSINWNTGELEYTGSTYTFTVDNNGYLHWGVV